MLTQKIDTEKLYDKEKMPRFLSSAIEYMNNNHIPNMPKGKAVHGSLIGTSDDL